MLRTFAFNIRLYVQVRLKLGKHVDLQSDDEKATLARIGLFD